MENSSLQERDKKRSPGKRLEVPFLGAKPLERRGKPTMTKRNCTSEAREKDRFHLLEQDERTGLVFLGEMGTKV